MPRPKRIPAKTPWGKTIDKLIDLTGIGLGELSKKLGRERSQVYKLRMERGPEGPTIELIESIIQAFEVDWTIWGKAYDAVHRENPHLFIASMTDSRASPQNRPKSNQGS